MMTMARSVSDWQGPEGKEGKEAELGFVAALWVGSGKQQVWLRDTRSKPGHHRGATFDGGVTAASHSDWTEGGSESRSTGFGTTGKPMGRGTCS